MGAHAVNIGRTGLALATAALAAVPLAGCTAQPGHPTPAAPAAATATTWHYVAAPAPGPKDGGFTVSGMAAVSSTDVWAVGSMSGGANKGDDGNFNALAFHYDGRSWTRVHVPGRKDDSSLNDVAATSGSDVWAVGNDGDGLLVDHFDGHRWTAGHPTAKLDSPFGTATAVAASSPRDVWVAGTLNPGFKCGGLACSSDTSNDKPILLHYDGRQWRRTGGLLDTDVHAVVKSLAVRGPDDVWAAGSWQVTPHSANDEEPLIAHWDGHTWTRVQVPPPVHGPARIDRIIVTDQQVIWASGSYGSVQGIVNLRPYVLRLDGTQWRQAPTEGLAGPLLGIAPDGHGGLWGGDSVEGTGGGTPQLRHFDGSVWVGITVVGAPPNTLWAPITTRDGVTWGTGTSTGAILGFAAPDHP